MRETSVKTQGSLFGRDRGCYHRRRLLRLAEVYSLLHPTADANRARWPTHGLWRQFEGVIGNELLQNRAGVLPSDVIHANRIAKMRELDALQAGLYITRAAISGVSSDGFEEFMENHVETLMRLVSEHSISVEERLAKARGRYQLD